MGDSFFAKNEPPPLLSPLNKQTLDSTWEILRRGRLQPPSGGSESPYSLARYQSVQATVRTLQLDHTRSSTAIISYIVAFILLLVVPICELAFVRTDTEIGSRQLLFQPVVVVVGVSRSVVSFLFLSQALREHGLQGLLFLDSVAQEVAQVRKDYDTVLEKGSKLFIKIFLPCLVLYVGQLIWLYSQVTLKSLPYSLLPHNVELGLVVVIMALSWIFQTTTYLYACTLFWKVCKLQELKMSQYHGMLLQGLEAEYYFLEYERIKGDLKNTSKRFRQFLGTTGVIALTGALISLYEVVDSINEGYPLALWGELIVLTLVNLAGALLCLSCASKIAHLHHRIVKRAAAVHARKTLANPMSTPPLPTGPGLLQQSASAKGSNNATPSKGSGVAQSTKMSSLAQAAPLSKIAEDGGTNNQPIFERLESFCQRQDSWARRAAIVEYLTRNPVGISIYGFILDRFFVHTSVGALLTTTWFILGRSMH